jgi:hypothetical protein
MCGLISAAYQEAEMRVEFLDMEWHERRRSPWTGQTGGIYYSIYPSLLISMSRLGWYHRVGRRPLKPMHCLDDVSRDAADGLCTTRRRRWSRGGVIPTEGERPILPVRPCRQNRRPDLPVGMPRAASP